MDYIRNRTLWVSFASILCHRLFSVFRVLIFCFQKKLRLIILLWMNDMKHQKIISSILILFLIATLSGCSSAVDQQLQAMPLFPDRHGYDLKQVTISDADSTSIDFKRVNCVWVIGNGNKPSDEPKITTLADKLVSMAPIGVATQKSDRFGDFKVGETGFSRKVVLTFKDSSSFTLLIGSPALTKPAYVRLANEKEVYMVDEPLLKQINLDTGTWLAPVEG